MAKYYVDACIWRDYLEDRSDKYRPIGEWALMFLKKAADHGDSLIISDYLLKELGPYAEKALVLVKELNAEFAIVNASFEQAEEAYKLPTPFEDTFHAIIARDNGCIFVTRDSHANDLRQIVEIHKPEELL